MRPGTFVITCVYDAQGLFREVAAVHRGARLHNLCRSGATTSAVLADQAPRVPPGRAGVVTIGVGTNDLSRQVPPAVLGARLEAIVRAVRGRTEAPVLLSNLPDVSLAPVVPPFLRAAAAAQVRSYNQEIARIGARHGLTVVDMYSASRKEIPAHPEFFSRDGYHPSDAGYRFWAEVMWPRVRATLTAAAPPAAAEGGGP